MLLRQTRYLEKRLQSIGQIKSKLCSPPNISTSTAPHQLEDAAGRKKALIWLFTAIKTKPKTPVAGVAVGTAELSFNNLVGRRACSVSGVSSGRDPPLISV